MFPGVVSAGSAAISSEQAASTGVAMGSGSPVAFFGDTFAGTSLAAASAEVGDVGSLDALSMDSMAILFLKFFQWIALGFPLSMTFRVVASIQLF